MKFRSTRQIQNLVLLLIIGGLLALALGGFLTPLTRISLAPLVSAQTWISERANAISALLSAPQDATRLRQENATLLAENARLQGELIEAQQRLQEVEVLSALLDFARANPQNEYAAATVIGRDSSPFLHYVLINRGSDDGLRRGMPVVTQQGLVGRIAAVTANAARVQLITDPAMRVNVLIQPSNAEAVLSGSLTGELTLDMIPQDSGVEAGNLVLTSGLGGNFVPNTLIGQISGVRKREYDLFQQATLQPVVDFSRLEIVLVITNFRPADTAPLIEEGLPTGQ